MYSDRDSCCEKADDINRSDEDSKSGGVSNKELQQLKSDVLRKIFNSDYEKDVVFFEVFNNEKYVLQVSMANAVSTHELWGRPYNVDMGANVLAVPEDMQVSCERTNAVMETNGKFSHLRKQYLLTAIRPHRDCWNKGKEMPTPERFAASKDKNPPTIFYNRETEDLHPSEFVKWVVANVDSVPILVSSQARTLLDTKERGTATKQFLNDCVFTDPCPRYNKTTCYLCTSPAIVIELVTYQLRCKIHAVDLVADKMRLYLPVIVDVYVDKTKMFLSTYNFPGPFIRWNTEEMIKFQTSRRWEDIAIIPHRKVSCTKPPPEMIKYLHNIYARRQYCQHIPYDGRRGTMREVNIVRCLLRNIWYSYFSDENRRRGLECATRYTLLTAIETKRPDMKPSSQPDQVSRRTT